MKELVIDNNCNTPHTLNNQKIISGLCQELHNTDLSPILTGRPNKHGSLERSTVFKVIKIFRIKIKIILALKSLNKNKNRIIKF